MEGRRVFEQRSALQELIQIWHFCTRKRIGFGIVLSQSNAIEKDKQDAHIAGLYPSRSYCASEPGEAQYERGII
jgi:hypothetical protein